MRWSLIGEYYSFFILAILYVRYHWYERIMAPNRRRVLFTRCLLLSMGSIAVNVISVLSLNKPGFLPVWCNMGLNSLYFLLSVCMCSYIAYMLFDATLEHVYDKHCLHKAKVLVISLTAVSIVFLAINLFTGILFYVDDTGLYQRGPLNSIFYFLPVVELVFLFICFVRNRESVDGRMMFVMRCIPPILLVLLLLQLNYPNVLLNGTISATVSLVIFIAFRTHTEEKDVSTDSGSRSGFLSELRMHVELQHDVQFIQISILNMADINLRYGYAVGDALLYEISRYLRYNYPNGHVFRTASVSFTLMLPLENNEQANEYLEGISGRMDEEWVLGDIHLMAPFAVAEMRCPHLQDEVGDIIERLEYTHLLAKKARGVVCFDENIKAQMVRRSYIIDLIQRSIEQGRFRVFYQPIFSCNAGRFTSAEALLRLSDFDGTPVPPDVFIPLAEESDLIYELTWVVLDNVCRMLSSGEAVPDSVSVNLSMQQLLDPQLPERIREYLDKYGLDAKRLKLEITERFILNDENYARRLLETLSEIGVEICMDDFGTGYSNLSSVLQYPFSVVKIDRSLIKTLPGNKQAAMMVDSLLQLFHNMDMRVVAEGVEEKIQADYLKERGVDMIQGYYYARPVPIEELDNFRI